jgi:hypothetical protein
MATPDETAPLLIVSADGHWEGPPSMYRDYMDPEFRDDLDALVEKDQAWRWLADPAAAEVLLPGHQETILPFFSQVSPPAPPAHRAAGAKAYHRQLADAMAGSRSRLVGVGDAGPCHDMTNRYASSNGWQRTAESYSEMIRADEAALATSGA